MAEPIIDKLERLEREATPGEWSYRSTSNPKMDRSDDDKPVWRIERFWPDGRPVTGPGFTKADCDFICEVRSALPAILSRLREQRELWDDAEDRATRLGEEHFDIGLRLLAAERTVREQGKALRAAERLMLDALWVKNIAEADYGMVCYELGQSIDKFRALAPDTEEEGVE